MTKYSPELLTAAHKNCTNNRAAIKASVLCGCFYCEAIYPASDVREYVCGNDAVCPQCGIDSVIADASATLDAAFLNAMYVRWFEDDVVIHINGGTQD